MLTILEKIIWSKLYNLGKMARTGNMQYFVLSNFSSGLIKFCYFEWPLSLKTSILEIISKHFQSKVIRKLSRHLLHLPSPGINQVLFFPWNCFITCVHIFHGIGDPQTLKSDGTIFLRTISFSCLSLKLPLTKAFWCFSKIVIIYFL